MEDVVTLRLENEMDLLLANRRTMKLAELCGMSLTFQTGIATAVSEVARTALSVSKDTLLKLGITTLPTGKRQLTALLCNTAEQCGDSEAFGLAKTLISEIKVMKGTGGSCDIRMDQEIKHANLITDLKVAYFIEYFKAEPPLSPYDEVRRKSIQLLEFSRKLEESENQYRRLGDTLPIMMFVASPDGQVIYRNKWLRNLLGDALTTIAPNSLQAMAHPDDEPFIRKKWSAAFRSGQPFTIEARLSTRQGGDSLWYLVSILPVTNEINVIVQWTGFLVDINAQKTVAAALRDNAELNVAKESLVNYQRQLEEKIGELNISNNELEQFAYIASHDLQEPLRKIATFSVLLRDHLHDLDDLSRMYFSRIISSSVQMTDQIKDVLEWSGLAKTKEPFSAVDLDSIIENVKSDLDVSIKERNAVIQCFDLPVVTGSRLQLIRLFSNLVSNALKFSNEAPIVTISSRILSTDDAGLRKKLDSSTSYAEVTVADNGVGFSPEFSEQIFRIFQRLHGHHQFKGTGIGLAICKKIAENHQGEIYATGNPGKGAIFTIILPIAHLN